MSERNQSFPINLLGDIVYSVYFGDPENPKTAKIEYVNETVEEIIGYTPDELLRSPSLWEGSIHPEDLSRVISDIKDLIETGKPKLREYRVRTREGRYIWIEEKDVPIFEKNRVVGFVGIARDITRRKYLEEVYLLALEGNLKELLQRAVYCIGSFLKADTVAVYEIREGDEECVLKASYGKESFEEGLRFPVREGTDVYNTLHTGEATVIEDSNKDRKLEFTLTKRTSGFRSGLCLPIKSSRQFYGVVCAYSKTPRKYRREELNFVESVSNVLGLAFERSEFEKGFEETEEKLRKANRLYRTLSVIGEIILKERDREALLRKVCTACTFYGGFKGAWVGFVEEGKLNLVSTCGDVENFLEVIKDSVLCGITRGVGTCGRAFITGKTIVNNDTRRFVEPEELREEMLKRNFLSSATIPLKKNGKVIGIFNLYADEENFFDEDTQNLVKEIGDQLSFALDFLDKEERLEKFSLAIEQTYDWVVITDRNGIIQYANKAVEEITGYKREELIGKKPSIFKSGKHRKEFYVWLWNTILSGKPIRTVFINRRKDGKLFYIDQTITPLKNKEGEIIGFVATGKDITRERELQERLNYFSFYDPITELPNRSNFMERLKFYISRSKITRRSFSVLVLDIDRFKYINDTYGYQVGDAVLREVAERIKGVLRPGDTVARFGSDEFGIALVDLARKEDIPKVISRIIKAMEEPYRVNGEEITLTVSIGVALFPEDGSEVEELIKKAEVALIHAKENYRNSYQFFTEEMNTRIAEFVLFERHLAKALEKKEYVIHYQPVYDLNTLKIHSAEALLRWNSEDLGLVSPSKFIPILEETGLIDQVGEWVLREVCRKIKKYKLTMSVNVSPAQFRMKNFPDRIIGVIREEGTNPEMLILEITESTIMGDVDLAKRSLSQLKKYGIKIAIDDFGTGYSSLAYLKLLPVDTLKIDVSFVKDIDRDPNDRAIVNAIVQLAKNLGLKTTAEGIENEKQLDILREMRCDFGQGYYLSRPLSEKELNKLLGKI